jgi:predicted CXXCH cytochrome family protein
MKHIVLGSLILCCFMLITTTAYAQDEEENEILEYVGQRDCNDCHGGISNDHELSPHALALSDEPEGILASFESGEAVRSVQFPGEDEARPFVAEDIAYVMGAGRYVQRYVYASEDGGYRVFPAEWNTVENIWQPFDLGEDWLEGDSYNWLTQCAGCHTTGLDVETGEWVDAGVQCEACHGPGSAHVELADELPRNPEPEEMLALRAAITISADAQICGQCHSQGVNDDDIHRFPTSYRPGGDLEDDYDLSSDNEQWWESGHGKASNMQFNEWMETGHDFAFDDIAGMNRATDECLTCHSADFRLSQRLIAVYDEGDMDDPAPEAATLDTAQFGVSCVACHDPHIFTEENPVDFFLVDEAYNLCVSCHTQSEITPDIHNPVQQMFEGLSLVDGVEGIPSAHFSAEEGPDCHTCHMPRLPVGSFSLASHTLQPIKPLDAEEGQPDSCSQCHQTSEDEITLVDLQSVIDGVQDSTRERLTAASDRLDSLEEPAETDGTWAIYNQVVNTLEFVRQDGSLGVHNLVYTDRLLRFAEMKLTELSTPTISVEPTEAPAPTSTPSEPAPILLENSTEAETRSGVRPITVIVMGITVLILLVAAWAFFRKSDQREA